MNMMIRPILPYYSSMTQADGFTIVSMLLLLIGAVFAAFCIAMYAANGQQGEKRKTVLLFMGITAIVTVTMLGFFGCAAVTVRGIILCLILLYSSYSDIAEINGKILMLDQLRSKGYLATDIHQSQVIKRLFFGDILIFTTVKPCVNSVTNFLFCGGLLSLFITIKHLITPSPVHHHRAFRVPRERTPTSAYPLNNR